MQNPFLSIVKKAERLNWCTSRECTTCGALKYRQALQKLGGPSGNPLIEALTNLDLKAITKVPGWQDPVVIALLSLSFTFGGTLLPMNLHGILTAWIEKAKYSDIDFLDVILFKIIREFPKDTEVRNQWVSRCTDLALGNEPPRLFEHGHLHLSMTESLVYVLGDELFDHPVLLKVASKTAKHSQKMQQALFNACGLNSTFRV